MELSQQSKERAESVTWLQRGQALAEQTVRNLHEENQSAEAEYLGRVKELHLTIKLRKAEANRLIKEKEQQELAHS
jgi:hypothetical protein